MRNACFVANSLSEAKEDSYRIANIASHRFTSTNLCGCERVYKRSDLTNVKPFVDNRNGCLGLSCLVKP